MKPSYLYSARKSRGRARQIGQDSQTSLLWLWSRSNSLPFPEALSAMTQGFYYRHNQRPPSHPSATQVRLTGDGVWLCPCTFILSSWAANRTRRKTAKKNNTQAKTVGFHKLFSVFTAVLHIYVSVQLRSFEFIKTQWIACSRWENKCLHECDHGTHLD